MIPASSPVQRPKDAKLLVVSQHGTIRHAARSEFVDLLCPGDLVIANDAATIPASLYGVHVPTGSQIEVRLAGRRSMAPDEIKRFSAVMFGEGNFRSRTEDRPLPPALRRGDRLRFPSLQATVAEMLGHPRLLSLHFDGSAQQIWEGMARDAHPIQYSHLQTALAIQDAWTAIAAVPVAFEPPSAGFALDWRAILSIADRGARFATITHAAGISSTGDPVLDARLPFDEPYRISHTTAAAIQEAGRKRRRVIAVGTTVVRALEHAALKNGVVTAGEGLATQRIGPGTRLRIVDAILSGTHEPATSHYELLRAFLDDAALRDAARELETHSYRTHEFGDSIFLERSHNVPGSDISLGGNSINRARIFPSPALMYEMTHRSANNP